MYFEDPVSREDDELKPSVSEELPMPQDRVHTTGVQRLTHLEK